MKTGLVTIFSMWAIAVTAQTDVRVVGGRSVDLAPVHKWMQKRQGERPMPHWQVIEVIAIQSRVATWLKCEAKLESGAVTVILMENIPQQMQSHLTQLGQLKAQVNALERLSLTATHRANVASAASPEYVSGNPMSPVIQNLFGQIEAANILSANAEAIKAKLEYLRTQLRQKESVKQSLLAMKTGVYSSLDVWNCGQKR